MSAVPNGAPPRRERYNKKGRQASIEQAAAAAAGRHHKRKREYDIDGGDNEPEAYGRLAAGAAAPMDGSGGALDMIDPVERKKQKQEVSWACVVGLVGLAPSQELTLSFAGCRGPTRGQE